MSWASTVDVPVGSVGTTFAVLETVLQADGATLSEVAEEHGIAHSTAHDHLTSLRRLGFLVKENNTYYIGLRARQFGEYARTRKALYPIVEEHVTELSEEVDATTGFSVEEHGRAYPLYRNLKYPIERSFVDKHVFYMHTSAVGKAMLAGYPAERVAAIVDRWGLPEMTDNSLTTEDDLSAELAEIADRGVAVNDEENRQGLRALAAPTTGPTGTVAGAISISGPTYWLVDDAIERLTPMLRDRAAAIEADIAAEYEQL